MLTNNGNPCYSTSADPDDEDFFSVWRDEQGVGHEVAGKIGNKEVAEKIARFLAQDEGVDFIK